MWNSDYGNYGSSIKQEAQSGGFLNTTTTSPGSTEKKKPERLTNVIACTIAQILKMPETDEYLKVGSMSAKIVTFVGIVQSVVGQSTKVTYVINDLSGPSIEVQIWVGENEEVESKFRNIQENTYVRVTGAVRSMKGKRHVIAFKIVPVKEVNEISLHILETIHTSMAIALMDKQDGSKAGFSATGAMAMDIGASNMTSFGASNNFATQGLSRTQQVVLQAISASNDDQGASIFDLYNNIKTLSRQAIKEAIEFLSNEGHIYSTIDEDHYKSTENM